MNKTFRFNVLPLIISVAFAVCWCIIGGWIYNALLEKLWTPLLISMYMTGLTLTMLLSIITSNSVCNNARPRDVEWKKTFVVICAILICTILFEFLYEINPGNRDIGKPTSYIFLIDDSGSMSLNDPNFLRNDSIYHVLQDCDDDFPYAIYSFADECKQILPISKASSARQNNYGFVSDGGTDIQGAIQYVLDDISSGVLQAGKSPRILLLSDGLSFYDEYQMVISECMNNNVSISTIGFGEADKSLLQSIAEDTRGAFVWVDDINQLTNAMNTAATTYISYARNLLGYRPTTEHDLLLSILRIVFILVLAVGFVLIKVYMFSTFDEKNIALYAFIAFAIIGAVGVEIGINALRYNPGYIRLLLCVFLSILFGSSREQVAQNPSTGGNMWNNANNIYMGDGFAVGGDKRKF